ncbi:MAG: metallophosphoesterase [Clostridia bacterium]|nr:metallophosphoesterase [Clostridia bacterium]
MKKIISVLLALVLTLSVFGICAAAADEGFKAYVATDTHYQKIESVTPDGNLYHPHGSLGKLDAVSPQILRQFLAEAAESDADYVFISGDITDKHSFSDAQAVAGMFAAFEEETGKQIFVINGNHDVVTQGEASKSDVDINTFKGLYHSFGYDEALAVDENSCSYVADLKNGYRLLAVDSCEYGAAGHGMLSEKLLSWIEVQVEAAKADGKKLVAMMHHNMMDHFTMEGRLFEAFVLKNGEEVCKKFSEWGIRAVFTGHFHASDVAVYEGKTNVYEIETTSLICYPLAYREATFTDDAIELKRHIISRVNLSDAPDGYLPEQIAMMSADLNTYAAGAMRDAVPGYVASFLSAQKVISLLKLDADSDAAKAVERLVPAVLADFEKPIYGEGDTVETMAKAAGIELPASGYPTVNDLITVFIAAHAKGDENFDKNSVEVRLLIGAMMAIFAGETENESASVKDTLTDSFFSAAGLKGLSGVTGLADLGNLAGDTDPVGAVTDLLLDVALEGVTVDKAPADNDVTLPGYANTSEDGVVLSFLRKLFDFFKKFIRFLTILFADRITQLEEIGLPKLG